MLNNTFQQNLNLLSRIFTLEAKAKTEKGRKKKGNKNIIIQHINKTKQKTNNIFHTKENFSKTAFNAPMLPLNEEPVSQNIYFQLIFSIYFFRSRKLLLLIKCLIFLCPVDYLVPLQAVCPPLKCSGFLYLL